MTTSASEKSPERATIFVDGNNWYHSLAENGVHAQGKLDYRQIAKKLVGPRSLMGLRYYVGQVPQSGNTQLYADQRAFFSRLTGCDQRFSVHTGRLEERVIINDCATDILDFLAKLTVKIDKETYQRLNAIAAGHRRTKIRVEKAVDVMLAVDAVVMAERNEYDTAYLLTADGDFTPVAQAVRQHGKKVFAVSLSQGAQLASAVNTFIRLKPDWFNDCYEPTPASMRTNHHGRTAPRGTGK